jgi:hypothetical protein
MSFCLPKIANIKYSKLNLHGWPTETFPQEQTLRQNIAVFWNVKLRSLVDRY